MKLDKLLEETIDKLGPVKSYIEKKYKESDIDAMRDDAVLNYLDNDWEEEFEDEYEWYDSYGHGEAEDEVIDTLIKEAKVKSGVKDFSIDDYTKMSDWLQNKYPSLDYF